MSRPTSATRSGRPSPSTCTSMSKRGLVPGGDALILVVCLHHLRARGRCSSPTAGVGKSRRPPCSAGRAGSGARAPARRARLRDLAALRELPLLELERPRLARCPTGGEMLASSPRDRLVERRRVPAHGRLDAHLDLLAGDAHGVRHALLAAGSSMIAISCVKIVVGSSPVATVHTSRSSCVMPPLVTRRRTIMSSLPSPGDVARFERCELAGHLAPEELPPSAIARARRW